MTTQNQNGLKRWFIGTTTMLTVALVLQTGALLKWTGTIAERINKVEAYHGKAIDRLDQRVYSLERIKPERKT